jgi:hypothetical protein
LVLTPPQDKIECGTTVKVAQEHIKKPLHEKEIENIEN